MTRDERLVRLEKKVADLLEQQAEVNLRVMFLLHNVRFMRKKPGGLIGPDGKEPIQVVTAAQRYLVERDEFQARMEAETERILHEIEEQEAEEQAGEQEGDSDATRESHPEAEPRTDPGPGDASEDTVPRPLIHLV